MASHSEPTLFLRENGRWKQQVQCPHKRKVGRKETENKQKEVLSFITWKRSGSARENKTCFMRENLHLGISEHEYRVGRAIDPNTPLQWKWSSCLDGKEKEQELDGSAHSWKRSSRGSSHYIMATPLELKGSISDWLSSKPFMSFSWIKYSIFNTQTNPIQYLHDQGSVLHQMIEKTSRIPCITHFQYISRWIIHTRIEWL